MIPDREVRLEDGVNLVTFDVLAWVETYDYSWDVDAILRRSIDGALFYVSDGGCSCNSFGDHLSTADLEPIFTIEQGFAKAATIEDRAKLKRSFELGEELER